MGWLGDDDTERSGNAEVIKHLLNLDSLIKHISMSNSENSVESSIVISNTMAAFILTDIGLPNISLA